MAVWGTGTPRREFLYADAFVFQLQNYSDEGIINIGIGDDITIADLARMIAAVVGFRGEITLDPSKPDGTPRKVVDTTRLNALGWRASTRIEEGLALAYNDFLSMQSPRER